MSFGFGVSDFILLFQLAWTTVEGAKAAVGEHDDLTKEIYSLYTVLDHLQEVVSDPESVINQSGDNRCRELDSHIRGCEQQLRQMNAILHKFNTLSEDDRSGKKLWQKIQFGNGPVKDVAQIRLKISTYTTAISMSLILLNLGSQGRMERRLSRQGGHLRGIRESVNLLVAKFSPVSREGSTMTPYSNDDPDFWKTLRRELVNDGYPSKLIRKHKRLIKGYVRELSMRGVLDDRMGRSLLSLDADSFATPATTHNTIPEISIQDGSLPNAEELQASQESEKREQQLDSNEASPINDVEDDHLECTDSRSVSTVSDISWSGDEKMQYDGKLKGKSKERAGSHQTARPMSDSLRLQSASCLADDQEPEQERETTSQFGVQMCDEADEASSYTYHLEHNAERSARIERNLRYNTSQEDLTPHEIQPMSPVMSEMLERIQQLEALNRRQEQLLLAVSNQIGSTEVAEGAKSTDGSPASTASNATVTRTIVEKVSAPSSPRPRNDFDYRYAYLPAHTPAERNKPPIPGPPPTQWRPRPSPPVIVNLSRRPRTPLPRKKTSLFAWTRPKPKNKQRTVRRPSPPPYWVNRFPRPTSVHWPSTGYGYDSCDSCSECAECAQYDAFNTSSTYDVEHGRPSTSPLPTVSQGANANIGFAGYTRRELGSSCQENSDETPIFELEA